MRNKKITKKNIVSCVAFLGIFVYLFISATYLFRGVDSIARNNILSFYNEKRDSLDVVVVGSSSAYRFFSPLDAWKQYGYTSFDYCAPAMSATTILSAVKDVEKHQSPRVIVLDVRTFLPEHMHEELDASVRNVLDVWDVGIDRAKAVKYSCDAYGMTWTEALSEYIDLIQYHDNYAALVDKDQWKFVTNRMKPKDIDDKIFKGYWPSLVQAYMDDTRGNLCDETVELTEVSERLYRELIDYCQEEGIEVVLTISPFCFSSMEAMQINSLEQIAEEEGIPFLNANRYLDEIGIDYAEDFYDKGHVNTLGAQKYTEFMSEYLKERWELPDHRGEEKYASWDALYETYEVKVEKVKRALRSTINNQHAIFALEEDMKASDSVGDWFWKAKGRECSLFIFKSGTMNVSADAKLILDRFGVGEGELLDEGTYMYMYSGLLMYSSDGETETELSVGLNETEKTFQIKCEDAYEIYYQDELIRQQAKEQGKIYIAAYDNIRGIFFDDIILDVAEDGTLRLER